MSDKKKLDLDLTEAMDGNVFSLLAYFAKMARRAGWSKEEIRAVQTDAMSGDYDHALQVLLSV